MTTALVSTSPEQVRPLVNLIEYRAAASPLLVQISITGVVFAGRRGSILVTGFRNPLTGDKFCLPGWAAFNPRRWRNLAKCRFIRPLQIGVLTKISIKSSSAYYVHQRKEVMFLPVSVCSSVCPLDYSKSYKRILMNFWRGEAWPKDQSIRFWLVATRITWIQGSCNRVAQKSKLSYSGGYFNKSLIIFEILSLLHSARNLQ